MNTLTESFLEAYDNRIAEVVSIYSDTAQKLSDFNADHQRMATEQRRILSGQIDSLRTNVTATLKSLDASQHKMAAELRGKLNKERERLLSDVSTMRAGLQTDNAKARKTWAGFTTKMQQRRAGQFPAPSKKTTATHAAAGMPHPNTHHKTGNDDLTVIAGIGANRRQRLNDMGIVTFAQLASSTVQQIEKAFGATARMANVGQWIKDARKMSGG